MYIQNIISLFYSLQNKHVMIYMQQKYMQNFPSTEYKFFWKQPLPGFFALSPNKVPFSQLHIFLS